MYFNLVERDGNVNIAVYTATGVFNADENHPNIGKIREAVLAGQEDGLADLFDASHRAAALFEGLSERIAVANSRIFLDGDELDDVYADQIVRFLDQGVDDWQPLVNFLEKVHTNTTEHTRESLSRWLDATGGFTIDADGDIIGYKGLTKESKSVRSGPGIVNGETKNENLDNTPGNVVEMARSMVEHNPRKGCAQGLHVGTWDYASSFGHGVVVKVKVNPRDVVSVPTDCGGQKMRVSRYEVLDYVNEALESVVVGDDLTVSDDYIDGYIDGYEDAEFDVPAKF